MKYLARIFYFILQLPATYIVVPIIIFIFCLVYLVWNLKWISKSCLHGVTAGWQEVKVGGIPGFPDKVYATPFHYLIRKEKK